MKIEITYIGRVKDLNEREDLTFISDSQDVKEVYKYFGVKYNKDVGKFQSFFVKVEDGEYKEVYGMHGIIPNINKIIYEIKVMN